MVRGLRETRRGLGDQTGAFFDAFFSFSAGGVGRATPALLPATFGPFRTAPAPRCVAGAGPRGCPRDRFRGPMRGGAFFFSKSVGGRFRDGRRDSGGGLGRSVDAAGGPRGERRPRRRGGRAESERRTAGRERRRRGTARVVSEKKKPLDGDRATTGADARRAAVRGLPGPRGRARAAEARRPRPTGDRAAARRARGARGQAGRAFYQTALVQAGGREALRGGPAGRAGVSGLGAESPASARAVERTSPLRRARGF